ncbi:solute carrier family 25 member 53 [Sceloporus undulatus]|uniref:solute carrier family 25 member 53 n=1 Tax=Sceloporus undulatus TaxID=8520 RepID=UPI001C4A767D|nr:solute carrier family 25 member 53 [Sceloporus undulatus]
MEEEKHKRHSDPGRSFWVGAASNFFSVLATFPFHKTMFRQQLHAFSIREAGHQLCQEGLRQFCRGLLPPLLAKTLQGTLMFGTYDTFLRALSGCRPPGNHHLLRDRATAGVLAGFSEGLVLGPFERVQNVLQDRRKVLRFPTTRSILREFSSYGSFRERMALGYYRGLGLILLRNGLGSSLYFSSKDPLRDHFSNRGLPAWLPSLLSGCINGTAISFLLYPLGVLITNVQAQVGRQETLGLGASVAAVWRTRGGRATLLYRGGSLLILRSGITWGLTTAIHDFLQGPRGQHLHSQPPPQVPVP